LSFSTSAALGIIAVLPNTWSIQSSTARRAATSGASKIVEGREWGGSLAIAFAAGSSNANMLASLMVRRLGIPFTMTLYAPL
jgi:hypothetical protein